MSRSVEPAKTHETSLAKDFVNLALHTLWWAGNRARPYLGGRRGLVVLVVAGLAIGGALNWSWLVAIGVAPLLLALVPCAVMCALGLCMMRKAGGGSCASEGQTTLTVVSGQPANDTRRMHSVRRRVFWKMQ